jgi:hypothetical protein
MAVLLGGHPAAPVVQAVARESWGAHTAKACLYWNQNSNDRIESNMYSYTDASELHIERERERGVHERERGLVGSQPLWYYWLETDYHPLCVYCSAAGHMQLDREEIIEQ